MAMQQRLKLKSRLCSRHPISLPKKSTSSQQQTSRAADRPGVLKLSRRNPPAMTTLRMLIMRL